MHLDPLNNVSIPWEGMKGYGAVWAVWRGGLLAVMGSEGGEV